MSIGSRGSTRRSRRESEVCVGAVMRSGATAYYHTLTRDCQWQPQLQQPAPAWGPCNIGVLDSSSRHYAFCKM
ncbi:hypothetical protein ABZP36_032825 [Zizania latifolia]